MTPLLVQLRGHLGQGRGDHVGEVALGVSASTKVTARSSRARHAPRPSRVDRADSIVGEVVVGGVRPTTLDAQRLESPHITSTSTHGERHREDDRGVLQGEDAADRQHRQGQQTGDRRPR